MLSELSNRISCRNRVLTHMLSMRAISRLYTSVDYYIHSYALYGRILQFWTFKRKKSEANNS